MDIPVEGIKGMQFCITLWNNYSKRALEAPDWTRCFTLGECVLNGHNCGPVKF